MLEEVVPAFCKFYFVLEVMECWRVFGVGGVRLLDCISVIFEENVQQVALDARIHGQIGPFQNPDHLLTGGDVMALHVSVSADLEQEVVREACARLTTSKPPRPPFVAGLEIVLARLRLDDARHAVMTR